MKKQGVSHRGGSSAYPACSVVGGGNGGNDVFMFAANGSKQDYCRGEGYESEAQKLA